MKGRYKEMSDERWTSENPDNQFTETGSPAGGDQNIIDGTAEVVSETVEPEKPSYEKPSYEKPSYENPSYENTSYEKTDYSAGAAQSYESYSTGTSSASSSEYTHADSGSATGNGSYQYSSSTHEYYQGENYGSSVGGSSGGSSGGRGKGFLAVVLAIIFGACIGAGFWGVHRYLGNTGAAETAIADSAENKGASVTGEKAAETEEEPAAEDAQQEVAEPADNAAEEQQAADAAAAEQQTTDAADAAAAEQQTTDAAEQQTDAQPTENATIADAEGIKNEAGLIIADSETPDTELTKVVDKVMPSIVSVYNDYTQEVQTFYGQTYTMQGESTGSGIIIGKTDEELLIVTNNHVVEGADNLRVLFIDEETCDAEIKGTDPSNDLAVIAVSLSSIKDSTLNEISVATLGNSDSLKIGEDVIAIGNALGYGQSVTTGIVSANNREISDETITGTFIQTDAAINPGNSGGALVNINGNVIGINSSKIGGDAVEGMGFAIPITRAIPIIEELMSHETLSKVEEGEQGTIGISGATVTSDVSSAYNMPVGVYVAQILENGGAAGSDLREGDIITAINGQTVTSMEDLQKMLQYYKAGTEVTLTVQRQDGNGSYEEASVKVTLGTRESIQSSTEEEQDGQDGQDAQNSQGRPGRQSEQQNSGESQQDQQGTYNPFEQFGFPFGN